MFKAVIALSVALLLALSAAWYGLREAGRYDGLYQNEIKLRVAAEARTVKIQTNLRVVSSNYASSELRLQKLLAQIPDRRTPVPVYNELCQRAQCAKLDSVSTPAD